MDLWINVLTENIQIYAMPQNYSIEKFVSNRVYLRSMLLQFF